MGYILEKQQKGEDKWERCNDFLVPVLSYTVRGLTEGKNYTFRVKSENAAGVSEPSRNTPFVKASDAIGMDDNRQSHSKANQHEYVSVSLMLKRSDCLCVYSYVFLGKTQFSVPRLNKIFMLESLTLNRTPTEPHSKSVLWMRINEITLQCSLWF